VSFDPRTQKAQHFGGISRVSAPAVVPVDRFVTVSCMWIRILSPSEHGEYKDLSMKLAVTYTILALIASLANFAAQDLATTLYDGPFSITISVIVGTGVGLVVKYILDKRYIFRFKARNAVHDGQTFVLYTIMGLLTTVIFWGFEFGFQYVFATKEMRYLGGAIGLAIGYVAKYLLDKRFVFRQEVA